MYYFQLSVDLETARGFLPFLYLLLRITSQEQATLYQQEQKEGKQYPMTHSFPNEPISCLVGFLKCCPLHLAPQMKLHQSGIATFGLWLRRSLSDPPAVTSLLREQKRHQSFLIPTSPVLENSPRTQDSRIPCPKSQACFCGHMMEPCLESHPMRQAQLEESVLKYAYHFYFFLFLSFLGDKIYL